MTGPSEELNAVIEALVNFRSRQKAYMTVLAESVHPADARYVHWQYNVPADYVIFEAGRTDALRQVTEILEKVRAGDTVAALEDIARLTEVAEAMGLGEAQASKGPEARKFMFKHGGLDDEATDIAMYLEK